MLGRSPLVAGFTRLYHLLTTLGNTLGATALGSILNIGIAHFGSGELADKVHEALNQPTGLSDLSSNPVIRAVFNAALHWSFWGVVAVAVLTFAATWLIPIPHHAGRKIKVTDEAREAMSH